VLISRVLISPVLISPVPISTVLSRVVPVWPTDGLHAIAQFAQDRSLR
jgi:hypothetical protein